MLQSQIFHSGVDGDQNPQSTKENIWLAFTRGPEIQYAWSHLFAWSLEDSPDWKSVLVLIINYVNRKSFMSIKLNLNTFNAQIHFRCYIQNHHKRGAWTEHRTFFRRVHSEEHTACVTTANMYSLHHQCRIFPFICLLTCICMIRQHAMLHNKTFSL